MFSGCPSVSACVHPSIHPSIKVCRMNQRTEFHETLVDDVLQATDGWIRF